MKILLLGVATGFMLNALPISVWAQDDTEPADRIEERLAQFRERLDLSDEQAAEVRPVLEESAQRAFAVMKKYGALTEDGQRGKRPDRNDLQAMRDELRENSENTNAQLAKILNADQMSELQALRQENQEEMRRRGRERRDSN